MPRRARSLARSGLLVFTLTFACSDDTADGGGASSSTAGGSSSNGGAGGAGGGGGAGAGFTTGGNTGAGGQICEPPDMLIALDRTLTMHRMPDGATPTDPPLYASSKWSQAITAIEGLLTPELDDTIRFGLELWPKEEIGCITLAERVEDTVQATNPFCSEGEVLLSPALNNSDPIHAALDPLDTRICISTPTGAGLLSAADHLGTIQQRGRDQYILLVTDGADWDQSCPTPDPVAVTQQLAASGVRTFVLGFSATGDILPNGVGAPFLNDMACAGMTAVDFATSCATTPDGYVAVDPEGPTLYLQASDAAALSAALDAVAALICCDCVR